MFGRPSISLVEHFQRYCLSFECTTHLNDFPLFWNLMRHWQEKAQCVTSNLCHPVDLFFLFANLALFPLIPLSSLILFSGLCPNEGEIMHEAGRGGILSMSHYTTLRAKKHEGRFFSMYHSHFAHVLVTDRKFSHRPIIVPLNVTQ